MFHGDIASSTCKDCKARGALSLGEDGIPNCTMCKCICVAGIFTKKDVNKLAGHRLEARELEARDEWSSKNEWMRDFLQSIIHSLLVDGFLHCIGTTDEVAMGYYLVKWPSEPYMLQADTEGMAGMISMGIMVAEGVYYNRVKRAPYWYTPLEVRAVFKMRHVLWTGLQLLDICRENMLPNACNRMEATHQKVVKVAAYEHIKS